jgi:hypothetical protein
VPAVSGSRAWRPAWVVLVLCLATAPAVATRFYASDEVEYFSWLHSIVVDHDADFQNEYQYFYDHGVVHTDGFRETFLDAVNEAGRRPNFTPIGTALLWTPWYAAGHLLAVTMGTATDGFSQPYIAAVAYGSMCYGWIALALSTAIAHRLIGRHGVAAAAAVLVGTPLLFYMYVAPGFSHACSAFAVALFVWQWLRTRGRWSLGDVAVLGLLGALLGMVREQDVFIVAGPALDFCREGYRSWRASRVTGVRSALTVRTWLARAAVGSAAFTLGYLPQLAAYLALNGHLGPTIKVTRKMTWSSPHVLGVLASPEHGFLVWTPLALVAAVGLVAVAAGRLGAAHRDARWVALLALVMIALQAYVSGCVESWTVAGSFGQRRFVGVTPLLVVGLAAMWPRETGRSLRGLGVSIVVALCVWWNVGLMAQFGLHLMDRQRLTPLDNARTSFLTLPRQAPAILWRYFTDRESFYGLPRQ